MRQSNIELLRILAAFGVIVQHYNNPNIGGAIRAVIPRSPNAMILAFLHVGMICAVDLFILISGYFMRDTKKRDLLKPVKLLSIWPADAFSLLEDGFHFMSDAGPALFGSNSVRMENDAAVRLHTATDQALYVVLLPRSLSAQAGEVCRSLQLYTVSTKD